MDQGKITGRDIIVFGLQPWDIPIGSNCKNIAEVFARHNRVLYVNRPLDRMSALRGKKDIQTRNRLHSIRKGENILSEIKENLWVFNPGRVLESINFLPPGWLYNYLNQRNNRRLANEIKVACHSLHFKNPILFIDNDFFNGLYLKDLLNPSVFIYYIRDYLRSQHYFQKHGSRSEPLIMAKADGVAANSGYLANYALQYNQHSYDVGQGCEVDDFVKPPESIPADLDAIPHPIIGYCGSITSTRLNVSLLEEIARQQPQWSIVLVGPADDVFAASALSGMANVHFLGSKKPAALSAYIHGFDVCINPQLLNQMTIGNYPRKVDEYLAAGKPVVATQTEAMKIFGSNVYLCNNAAEYIDAIYKALSNKEDEAERSARQLMGMSHTWDASVDKIYSLIKTVQK